MPNATDSNQAIIMEMLRRAGCSVQSLHTVGHGCPDLLVARNGITVLMEVKTEKGRLSTSQMEWIAHWKGRVYVVRSPEEALEVIQDDRYI